MPFRLYLIFNYLLGLQCENDFIMNRFSYSGCALRNFHNYFVHPIDKIVQIYPLI